jgi:predicted Zn-ribbon and HTH transcriptional regulator
MASLREAHLTLPQALRAALAGTTPKSLDELSAELGVSVKVLPDALDKLSRSLAHGVERLQREPPRCLACGFEFQERTRTKRPSRCPSCSSERLTRPRFWIDSKR